MKKNAALTDHAIFKVTTALTAYKVQLFSFFAEAYCFHTALDHILCQQVPFLGPKGWDSLIHLI